MTGWIQGPEDWGLPADEDFEGKHCGAEVWKLLLFTQIEPTGWVLLALATGHWQTTVSATPDMRKLITTQWNAEARPAANTSEQTAQYEGRSLHPFPAPPHPPYSLEWKHVPIQSPRTKKSLRKAISSCGQDSNGAEHRLFPITDWLWIDWFPAVREGVLIGKPIAECQY